MKKNNVKNEATNPQELNITNLKIGESATIIAINGDDSFVSKIETMGINPNTVIKKISGSFLHGSIVVEKDTMQIALSYHIAKKIIVKQI